MPDLQQNSGTNKAIEILCTSGSGVVPSNTPTITLRKNGGTGAAATGTVTASDTYGVAYYTPSSADCDTLGPLTIEVSGTGIDSYAILGWTVKPDNPYARFPAAAPGADGGLPTLINTTNGTMVRASVEDWGGNGAVLSVDDFSRPIIGAVYGQVLGNASTGVLGIAGPGVWAFGDSGFGLASATAVSGVLTAVNGVSTAVANIQNNTFVASNIPTILERPDSGSEAVLLTLTFADETGSAHDIDAGALPTVTLVDNASTSLAARLSAWTHAATGKYTATYTNSASDALENIHWEVTATVNTKLRRYVVTTQIVDTTAVDFTSADRTNLNAIVAKLPAGAIGDATAANQTTILTNLGTPMQANAAVSLAASQPNYAPAKAGDKMDLVNAPNATALAAAANALLDLAAAIDPSGAPGETLRKALRLILATTAGTSAGGGTATQTFKSTDGTKSRVAATVDTNAGNRTAITYDAS